MSNENKHVVGALESFLRDVREGESSLDEFFNLFGENELRYLLKMAKMGEDSLMSNEEFHNRMNAINERMEKRTQESKELLKEMKKRLKEATVD